MLLQQELLDDLDLQPFAFGREAGGDVDERVDDVLALLELASALVGLDLALRLLGGGEVRGVPVILAIPLGGLGRALLAVLQRRMAAELGASLANGQPTKVFLSADPDRPTRAEQDGLGVPRSRFTLVPLAGETVLALASSRMPAAFSRAPMRCAASVQLPDDRVVLVSTSSL